MRRGSDGTTAPPARRPAAEPVDAPVDACRATHLRARADRQLATQSAKRVNRRTSTTAGVAASPRRHPSPFSRVPPPERFPASWPRPLVCGGSGTRGRGPARGSQGANSRGTSRTSHGIGAAECPCVHHAVEHGAADPGREGVRARAKARAVQVRRRADTPSTALGDSCQA